MDGEAQKLLKTLRDEKLPAKMPESNIVRFKVEWGGKEGIDMETHKVRPVYKARYTECEHAPVEWYNLEFLLDIDILLI